MSSVTTVLRSLFEEIGDAPKTALGARTNTQILSAARAPAHRREIAEQLCNKA